MSAPRPLDLADLIDECATALDHHDLATANKLIEGLLSHLRALDTPLVGDDLEVALDTLQLLRNARRFALVARLADCLIQTGHRAAKIRRLCAQALIDENLLETGRAQLLQLLAAENLDEHDPAEYRQAHGLLGRIDKQIFLNAGPVPHPWARCALRRAIGSYRKIYDADPSQVWHGINAAALLLLAGRQGLKIDNDDDPGVTGKQLAGEILRRIERLHRAGRTTVWDYATAAEASLADGNLDRALQWMERFAAHPASHAFHLASAERQMRQVWGLSSATEAGARLLQTLRAAILYRDDREIDHKERGVPTGRRVDLEPEDLDLGALDGKSDRELEKVFGQDRFTTVSWWLEGLEASKTVARIGRRADEGEGTGFLVAGRDLHEALGDELLLLTNAHVVSEDPEVDALRPDEVVVTFASQDQGRREFRVVEQLWSSPPGHFDATLLRLDRPLDGVAPVNLAKRLPVLRRPYRVYVIGHPGGRGLSFSIQDNKLLDHGPIPPADVDLGIIRVHYRTPTEPGSSGSPVFNRDWQLIGLHHKGSQRMRRLNRVESDQEPETYAANEGIGIQSIRAALDRDLQVDSTGDSE